MTTWQAWHLVTSTFVSRGRCGTRLTHFAWQAWHVWHWASSGGALGSHVPSGRRGFLCGRRGTWRHSSSFHVAGVVLASDIHLRFTWQAWYSTYSHTTCSHTTYSHATYSRTTCALTTYAGVALGEMYRHFAWQAWHVWHWAGSGGALGSHMPEWSPRLFAWQAWHLETFIFVSRGRRGTW